MRNSLSTARSLVKDAAEPRDEVPRTCVGRPVQSKNSAERNIFGRLNLVQKAGRYFGRTAGAVDVLGS